VIGELQRITNLRITPCLASQENILRAQLLYRGNLLEMLRQAAEEQSGATQVTTRSGEATAPTLLNRILEYAAVSEASDIHIEPYEHETLVRYRIDGVLREVLSMPAQTIMGLAVRVKALSGMRVDDRRSAQDGRFDGDLGSFKIDLRVSTLPTHWGEKIVMRVLSKEYMTVDLEGLGFAPDDYEIMLRQISRPHGMVLVTGPTGSGKSTTLYAMLARLGSERNLVNISTIEDPVEHPLARISQVSVNPLAGIDFASGLRSLLRQDPDIIMVGEIRDRDTAEIAIRAALVGRLLLSTLHTNDATSAVPRLLDMGVEPFLLASTLAMVVAQRLVRLTCVGCRESFEIGPEIVQMLSKRADYSTSLRALRAQGLLGNAPENLQGVRLFRGNGCRQCGGSGYRGRIGLFEILTVDDEIRKMMHERRDAASIRAMAIERGMKPMFQDGLAKLLLGQTTAEELVRVTA
jgi:type II secretory ATPase GspE/PulE/Tfp pilus assembly ATPase PilB-like protein